MPPVTGTGVTPMERDHVAVLIGERFEKDALSQLVPVEHRREIFCTIGSVQQSEFFGAGRKGFRPQLRVKVFSGDYEGESLIEVDGVRYGIYRTYLNDSDQMELYLEKKGGA